MTTTQRIEALRNEAANHGDSEQVELCDSALLGDATAHAKCVAVVTEHDDE